MTTTWNGYRITSRYTGSKPAPWSKDMKNMPENWNHHVITISKNGKRASFDFWGSLVHPEITERPNLLDAFSCFLSDAQSGMGAFEDFCMEIGYDEDSRSAERIWKACVQASEKAERVLGSDDIYELIDALHNEGH